MKILAEQEIELFKAGIKPAILMTRRKLEEYDFNFEGYVSNPCGNSLLITHEQIPNPDDFNGEKLGVLLGYYPKSCKEFWNEDLKDEVLYFGGICFNTKGYTKEALDWCKKIYAEDIINLYGKLDYTIREWKPYGKQETLKRGVITRRNY